MFTLGPLGFANPLLLLGLIALPVLWLLLRAVPPAPIRRRFPGVALLLGLQDEDAEADKTPWWLLLLRLSAVAAVIIAFAGPVLDPREKVPGEGRLLIAMDAGWSDARDWSRRMDRVSTLVEEAGRDGRTVALIRLTDAPGDVVFQTADALLPRLVGVAPQAWLPVDMSDWISRLPEGEFDTYWLSDGLDHPGRASLYERLASSGQVTVFESNRPNFALFPAVYEGGAIELRAARSPAADPLALDLVARGPDPAGIERELARVPMSFATGADTASVALSVPPELRNRITRFELSGVRSAGAVILADDSLKRRKVALVGARDDREGLQLLSPNHYLRQALAPVADLMEGSLTDLLIASPDVVILADVARLSQVETDALLDWLDGGGMLLRFAGPHLAASDISRFEEDPLMPVRLREGGRTVGGAMSWGEPKSLAPFPETSPFHGLVVPEDVQVSAQVLAQPDPELAERTIAALTDGTPLLTRKTVGQGQIVLVHVTANAEWSTLPLSGLFMQMLERLAISTRPAVPDAIELSGMTWVPELRLDAFGQLQDAGELPGVAGEVLSRAFQDGPDAENPPGVYAAAERRVAINAVTAETVLVPASWPQGAVIEGLEAPPEQSLKGAFLSFAFSALMLDILAALWVSGRLGGLRRGAVALIVGAMLAGHPSGPSQAQTDTERFALDATTGLVLAYVKTGDARVDDLSRRGLVGLGSVLWARTSIEPDDPIGVDIESDELAFFPFLYWPVTSNQSLPSAEAYRKLNDYMRTGGLILFDTRDGDLPAGGSSPEAQHLQRIAAGLDIPPLEQIPRDHVLTRTFYLLQDFPGRSTRAPLWVEAAPPDAEQVEGMPFRNLNDGVTPVIFGGNDWAAAWAISDTGAPLLPVGRGFAGEKQREMAYRFGVNLVMHVLTGNYKSDQVHVPALLDRLGQ